MESSLIEHLLLIVVLYSVLVGSAKVLEDMRHKVQNARKGYSIKSEPFSSPEALSERKSERASRARDFQESEEKQHMSWGKSTSEKYKKRDDISQHSTTPKDFQVSKEKQHVSWFVMNFVQKVFKSGLRIRDTRCIVIPS